MSRAIIVTLWVGSIIAIGWALYEFPNEAFEIFDALVKSHSESPFGFE